MVHAFICSKPFQFINLLNLPYDFEDKSVSKILIVLDHFPEAEAFVEKLKEVFPFWSHVYMVGQREQIAKILSKNKVSKLYSELDTGKVAYVWSLIVKEMNVYEEGTQTYRNIRTQFDKGSLSVKLKQGITKLLGWGAYLGSNRKTRSIYVYNPTYFKNFLPFLSQKAKYFRKELYQFLEEKALLLEQILPVTDEIKAIKNQRIAVYITSHSLNDEIMQKLRDDVNEYDQILIKVHPHFSYEHPGLIANISKPPFKILTGNTLAEMMFMTFIKNGNSLSIFHESSTACLYLRESDKVNIYDYRKGEYREFYKNLLYCYNNPQLASS